MKLRNRNKYQILIILLEFNTFSKSKNSCFYRIQGMLVTIDFRFKVLILIQRFAKVYAREKYFFLEFAELNVANFMIFRPANKFLLAKGGRPK